MNDIEFLVEYFSDPPATIHVCHCEQCKAAKNKKGNRKEKKRVRKLLNKLARSRKQAGKHITYYWG